MVCPFFGFKLVAVYKLTSKKTAIIPAEFMPGTSNQDLGTHCFQYVRPEFRQKAAQGFTIVVAGSGFGSGSSREEAPRALLGCGIQAVVAKSYAYIYGRNQPNMALLGVIVKDEGFYERAKEGRKLTLHLSERVLSVSGNDGQEAPVTFPFELSRMEEAMIQGGGVTELYRSYGPALFRAAIAQSAETRSDGAGQGKAKKQKICGTETAAEQEALSW